MERNYQVCTRCIMDTSDLNIEFDKGGVCNHCRMYFLIMHSYNPKGEAASQKLKAIVREIKKQGLNKEYDCLMGVSGGVDSTYVVYLAKILGLRPLAVHLDNGWNAELAVNNIEQTMTRLDVDLYTHVIDWEEFKDLQLAYLKSGVVNMEVLTDHAIWAILYEVADKRDIKYILSGVNLSTEAILPKIWGYSYTDLLNIKDIHNKYGTVELKTFPMMSRKKYLQYTYEKGIKVVAPLNYISYKKNEVKPIIQGELGWKDYSGKHGESIFTYFYQSYILPRRIKADKRRAHLSCLICAGEITREQALEELLIPLYSEDELRREKEYVIKKWGISEDEFEKYMNLPSRSYGDFKTDLIESLYYKLIGTPKMMLTVLTLLGYLKLLGHRISSFDNINLGLDAKD